MKVLLSYLKPHLGYFLVAYLLIIISSIAILAFGHEMRTMLDSGAFNTPSYRPLVAISMLALVMSTTSFFRLWLSGKGAERVVRGIRKLLYDKIVSLSPAVLENVSASWLMGRLITDMVVLRGILSGSVLVIFRNGTVLTGSIAMLVYTNPRLTAHMMFVVPVVLLILSVLGKRVKSMSRLLQGGIDDLAHFTEETCRGIGVIQSFTAEDKMSSRFSALLNRVSNIAEKHLLLRTLLITLVLASIIGSVGLIFWMGIRAVAEHSVTAGSMISFIFYAALAVGAVNNIGDNVQDLQKAASIMESVSKLLQMNSGMADNIGCCDISEVKESVEISNVTFSYPGKKDLMVLKNVSFSVRKGERIAIVGHSGSGKSTITHLLMRFYDVNEGSITIDGVDARNVSLRSLRSLFCVVPQNPMIFSGTILDNITYGINNYTKEQLEVVMESASIAEFVRSLPEGLNTFVGERGVCLSEGQKQRLVIARAMLRRPEVLILDEATAALDSDNESKIRSALTELMRGKLTITIAHNLSTIVDADRIVVLNKGTVQEIGTHKELMQDEKSLYARLVKLQQF